MLNALGRFCSQIRALWRRICRHDRFAGLLFIDQAADPRSLIRKRRLVLMGTREKSKWLRFACPCRCGDTIALNLMTSHHPHWTVQVHEDETVTVHPSVDATRCGSHFWIRHSRIEWV